MELAGINTPAAAFVAGLVTSLHCAAMCGGFVAAYPFAFLVNRYLIARGKGHAVVHEYHHHSS